MRSISSTAAYINIMGHDFEAEIDYVISSYGSPPIIDYVNGGDPGEDPEWDIQSITLREDRGWSDMGPDFEATGMLLLTLCNNSEINDAIMVDMADRECGYDY